MSLNFCLQVVSSERSEIIFELVMFTNCNTIFLEREIKTEISSFVVKWQPAMVE